MDTVFGVEEVRDRIRSAIMDGSLAPGTLMPQGPLARQLGISRTPMREALRMLQEEGLVEIERNRRARVADFNADDFEQVYATRILLSATATLMTVPRMTDADVADLRATFEDMRIASAADDSVAWRVADRRFHRLHLSKASPSLLRELDALFDRAALFRLLRLKDQPHRQTVIAGDHEAVVAACEARDGSEAAVSVARHLSRVALTLLARTNPDHDPSTIRAALNIVTALQR